MPPLNRIIAFFGPYISLGAGTLATYLFAKLNVLGIQGLDESQLATDLAALFTFGLTTIVTWLGQSKWLTGHHIELAKTPVKTTVPTVHFGDSPTVTGSVDEDLERGLPEVADVNIDPEMGEPLAATHESYLADPSDTHGAEDHPA